MTPPTNGDEIQVVDSQLTTRGGKITLRAAKQELLTGMIARQLVIEKAAAQGLMRPGVSGRPTPYPVDAEGKTGDDVFFGRVPTAAYHIDYPVAAGI